MQRNIEFYWIRSERGIMAAGWKLWIVNLEWFFVENEIILCELEILWKFRLIPQWNSWETGMCITWAPMVAVHWVTLATPRTSPTFHTNIMNSKLAKNILSPTSASASATECSTRVRRVRRVRPNQHSSATSATRSAVECDECDHCSTRVRRVRRNKIELYKIKLFIIF